MKKLGALRGLITLAWEGVRMDGTKDMEISVQEKIDTLMRYRRELEGSERELFDILLSYANEIALAVDRNAGAC